jgi:hypothetical protein
MRKFLPILYPADVMTPKASAVALAVTMLLPVSAVHATEQTCPYYAPQDWMPRESAEAKARELGYEKFFVQPDGGCWTIYTTKDGSRWRIMIDPKTGAIVRQGQT